MTGTADIREIIAAQGPGPLRWHAFRTPASSLAFLVYLHALGLISARPRLSASLYVAPAAVLGAVLFLGGWPLADSWVGLAVLAAKSVLLLLAAGGLTIPSKVAASASMAAIGLVLAGWLVDFDLLLPQWSAMILGVLGALGLRVLLPPLRGASAPVPA